VLTTTVRPVDALDRRCTPNWPSRLVIDVVCSTRTVYPPWALLRLGVLPEDSRRCRGEARREVDFLSTLRGCDFGRLIAA
jgi:hypothetical protein